MEGHSKLNVTESEMSHKRGFHSNWNVTMEYHPNWNVTQIGMSHKLKCRSN